MVSGVDTASGNRGFFKFMAENGLERRKLIKGGAALGGIVGINLLFPGVISAAEEFALNSKVGMFHFENGSGIASFIRQMENEGRVNLFASELGSSLREKKPVPPSYVITVDDGYSIQSGIFDYLSRQNLSRKITFYVMGDWRGDGVHSYMSQSQIKELSSNGSSEVGCHTRDHPQNLPALRVNNFGSFMLQIDGAKKFLEDLTGKPVLTFAYPYGNYDSATAQEISNLYLAAFTTQPGNFHALSRSNMLPRIGVN